MKPSALHYYRAVAYYYLADAPNQALTEIYQSLECEKNYAPATQFAKKLSRTTTGTDNRRANPGLPLAYLSEGNYDLFLISLLAQDESGSFILSRIDWQDLLLELDNSPKPTDRVWCRLLRQQWEQAFAVHRYEFDKTQGNAVAYFQSGYLFCCTKAFIKAEPQLLLLTCFGGVYRLAAIRLLLHLPQHLFSSLADFAEILAAGASPEKFQLARLLQSSWDQRGFRKFLKIVQKHTTTAQEYIALAGIYLDEGKLAPAMRALRKAHQRDSRQIATILQLLTARQLPPKRALIRFWCWLSRQLQTEEDLCRAAQSLRTCFPQIALSLYHRLEKITGAVPPWQLGQAICFYHLGKFTAAEGALAAAGQARTPEIIYWQSKLAYRQQRYQQALALAEDGLASFPTDPLLKKNLQQLAATTCPNCDHPLDSRVCPNCGYAPAYVFKAQDGKLRWQGEQLLFPQAIALLTTSAQSYAQDQPVYLFIFATVAGAAHLCFYWQGEIVRRREVSLVTGLVVVKEKNFPGGLYQVELLSENHHSNRHFFMVSGTPMPLRAEIVTLLRPQPHLLDLVLSIKDFLGFPVQQSLLLHAGCPELHWEYRDNLTPDRGKLSLSWQFPRPPGLIVLYLSSRCGKQGTLIIPPEDILNPEEIHAVIYEGQKRHWQHLPVAIEFSSEHDLRLQFARRQAEVVVGLQPLGQGPCNVHRFHHIESGQILSVPIEKPLTAFYLGTGRHRLAGVYQSVGWEYCGLLVDLRLQVQLQVAEIVAPGEEFTLTIRSSRFCQGVLIFSADSERYPPLSRYLVALLSRLTTPESEEESGSEKALPVSGSSSITPFHQVRQIEIRQCCEINLTAPQPSGCYRIVVVATDGTGFSEQEARLQVISQQELHADFPEAIGPGDTVTVNIDYRQPAPEILQIIDNDEIVLQETVTDSGNLTIEVTRPGTWAVNFGDDRQQYHIHALEQLGHCRGDLCYLAEGKSWSHGETTVYPHGLALSKHIIERLLADPYQGLDTLTAQIYCAVRLYQFYAADKQSRQAQLWQERIETRARHLARLVKADAGGRWSHWPDERADQKITAEIAHHLAPFRELFQFPRLHHLAHTTLDAAISWRIKDNRLLAISSDFGSKNLHCPGATALACQYGFRTRKSRRHLGKLCRALLAPHPCDFLGGPAQCLALFCKAQLAIDPPLAIAVLNDYFRRCWYDNGMSNPAATVAFVDLLLTLEQQSPRISSGDRSFYLEQPQALVSPFKVDEGYVWCYHEREQPEPILPSCRWRKPAGKWHGPSPLRPGDEFRLTFILPKLKYPYSQILVPANICLLDDSVIHHQTIIWPYPERKIVLHGKARRPGTGTLYLLTRERYPGDERPWADKYQITVLADAGKEARNNLPD